MVCYFHSARIPYFDKKAYMERFEIWEKLCWKKLKKHNFSKLFKDSF